MARVLTHRRELDQAERLAQEAVQLTNPTDNPIAQADTRLGLAAVLETAGRASEAAQQVQQALSLYQQKGDLVSSGHARTRLDNLLQRAR